MTKLQPVYKTCTDSFLAQDRGAGGCRRPLAREQQQETTIASVLLFVVGVVFLLCTALPVSTWALPAGSHYMVSPASCQPGETDNTGQNAAASASRLYLFNGAWTFRPGMTGAAELTCPINLSGSAGQWSLVQLWYRDEYTALGSNDGFVTAELMRRRRRQPGTTALAFTNSQLGNGEEYGFHTQTSLPAGPENFQMYYLRVRMYRAGSGANVAFTGFEIRF